MELDRKKILDVVIKALREAQYEIGENNENIAESTKPIGDLKYFDSLSSVYVTVHCLDTLGYNEELKMPSLFIDKEGNALTVGRVVDEILKLFRKNN
ncbi:MAG: hypothetical protein CVU55_03085 [Deltaproteobacteria bacterium HGW-Deltaproteobacteria-13]|jgi:hypothetical protein|nr:MAG: hypothetical protein CVU55_03085 [Deltaproteobacteria bacterium HGW-Deltaproteobacteria-13]